MNCPSEDILCAYCERELSQDEQEFVDKHLTVGGGCRRCAEIVDRIQQMNERLETLVDQGMISRLTIRLDRDRRRRRILWQASAAAAALILISVSFFGTATEAGNLDVEIHDPTVTLLIEGLDIVISGEGVQEVRLRPGSYRLRVVRDGEPDQEASVTITRGGKRTVRISQGGGIATVQTPGVFVVLASGGPKENKFDSLAEAVAGARNGDTIEIRSSGPFWSDPIQIHRKSLTIRAAPGVTPLIKLKPEAAESDVPLIETDAPLVLEGLDLWRVSKKEVQQYVVKLVKASLYAVNCRFVLKPKMDCVHANDSSACVFLNCVFNGGHAFSWHAPEGGRLVMENCLQTGRSGVHVHFDKPDLKRVQIGLRRNTFVGMESIKLFLHENPEEPQEGSDAKPLQVATESNVFDTADSLFKVTVDDRLSSLRASRDSAVIRKLVEWNDRQNLYAVKQFYLDCWGWQAARRYENWNEFWAIDPAESVEGPVRFQGEDVHSRIGPAPESLRPQEFRLVPAGPREGSITSGPVPGIDADLVGPGEPFERWKKSTEYQKWLRMSGQKPLAGLRIGFVIAHDNFWHDDYQMHTIFEKKGALASIISSKTGDAVPQSIGTDRLRAVQTDLAIDQAKASEFDALVVCGGRGRDEFLHESSASVSLRNLVREVLASGGFVMGIGDGVLVLGAMGAIQGKEVTTHLRNKEEIEKYGGSIRPYQDKDGQVRPQKVVRSGNVITVWHAHAELANGFVNKLANAVSERDFDSFFPTVRDTNQPAVPQGKDSKP